MTASRSGRWLGAGLLALALTAAGAQDPLQEVVRDDQDRVLGRVDWPTRQVIAIGRARRQAGRPTAFLERAAKADAYANLAAAARLARIGGDRRVDRLVRDEEGFRRYFVAYVRYAEFGPLQTEQADWATIAARAPLFGVQDGDEPRRMLGTELYRRDDVWAKEVVGQAAPERTGVLLDAREQAAPGAFAPTVRDTSGRVVWTVECADREVADRAGAVEYWRELDAARRDGRQGADAVVVKVVAVTGGDVIVSEADGARLAPPRQAWRPGWCFAGLGLIRTITPVSPFRSVSCVSTPKASQP